VSGNVLMFPGQGAQKVGMCRDVFEAYGAARGVFAAACEAIDVDVCKVCFEGPAQYLARTDMCQPAMLTAGIAVLRAIEQELGRPVQASAAAGLSLGEYGALVAAGALDFGDAVRLIYARGRYMQETCDASAGAMYSVIALADAQVEEACRKVRDEGGRVWPANYNSPGQVAISGEEDSALRAAQACSEMGARKTVRLKVAGAFHTPLMQPAADRLAEELARTQFRAPAFPVVANATGLPVGEPAQMRDSLARQVTSPVRWVQSMLWCRDYGGRRFVEVGPGRVLQGLLKRIDAELGRVSVGTAQDVADVAASL